MNHMSAEAASAPLALALNCTNCPWRAMCLPAGLAGAALEAFSLVVGARRTVLRNERLHAAGAPFGSLYAVLCGEFKTQCAAPAGGMQLTGVVMTGELLGLDAIASGRYESEAVALSDSMVCVIPYAALAALMARQPVLALRFHALFSAESARRQRHALLLGKARAPQRLALLLLDLSARYAARGRSGTAFHLSMSREDIAAYTCLTVESISRLLSRFKQTGVLDVSNRDIVLSDPAALHALAKLPP